MGGVKKDDYKLSDRVSLSHFQVAFEKIPRAEVFPGSSTHCGPISLLYRQREMAPASRAALFALKLTVAASSTKGIISISRTYDRHGQNGERGGAALRHSLGARSEVKTQNRLSLFWLREGIRMGFVDASLWQLPSPDQLLGTNTKTNGIIVPSLSVLRISNITFSRHLLWKRLLSG